MLKREHDPAINTLSTHPRCNATMLKREPDCCICCFVAARWLQRYHAQARTAHRIERVKGYIDVATLPCSSENKAEWVRGVGLDPVATLPCSSENTTNCDTLKERQILLQRYHAQARTCLGERTRRPIRSSCNATMLKREPGIHLKRRCPKF